MKTTVNTTHRRVSKGESDLTEPREKYARELSELIRCETVNAGGVYAAEAFEAIEGALARLFPRVFAEMTRIGTPHNLLLRWKGEDESKPALVLMAHLDVVPAPGDWTHPPFSGLVADGMIYGRGAMDTKCTLYAMYRAAEELLEKGFKPPADIYFTSSHNEETFGDGAVYARDYFAQHKIPVAMVLDEGGAVVQNVMPGFSGYAAMIGVTEKGYANIRFTAGGKGGHASAPPRLSPLVRLSAFVNRVEKRSPFKARLPGVVKEMLKALSPGLPRFYRFIFSRPGLFGPVIRRVMASVSPQAAAMLKTTCAFTMAEGSPAANVLPLTASVTANLRFIGHQPMRESIGALKRIASKYDLTAEVLAACDISPETSVDSPGYRLVRRTAESVFPGIPVSPYIMIGGTDSRHFASLCDQVIRFSPLMLTPEQLSAMHAADERIGADALLSCVRFYAALIEGSGAAFTQ